MGVGAAVAHLWVVLVGWQGHLRPGAPPPLQLRYPHSHELYELAGVPPPQNTTSVTALMPSAAGTAVGGVGILTLQR